MASVVSACMSDNQSWKRYEDTGEANFKCTVCHRFWSSQRATVVFYFGLRKTPSGGNKGEVRMQCLGQKCRRCCHGDFVSPKWDEMEIDDMLSNLRKKITNTFYSKQSGSGVSANLLAGLFSQSSFSSGSHRSDLCQACEIGVCSFRDGLPTTPDDWADDCYDDNSYDDYDDNSDDDYDDGYGDDYDDGYGDDYDDGCGDHCDDWSQW